METEQEVEELKEMLDKSEFKPIEKKGKKLLFLIPILLLIGIAIGYKTEVIDNYDLLQIGIMIIIVAVMYTWIKLKKKLGIEKKELSELQLLIKEKEILIEEHEKEVEELDKKIDGCGGLDIGKWAWVFINLGLVVFFASLLYFGSLDGTYLNREIYEASINNSMDKASAAIAYSGEVIADSFQYLVMKFYDLGAREPTLMFWMFWVLIFYWIGYIYIYIILLEGSYKTIKELFVPWFKEVAEVVVKLKRNERGNEKYD